MQVVSRFEANLLRILYTLLGQSPLAHALPMIVQPSKQPPCLSAETVQLVQRALAKGTVALLARTGGWYQESFLRDGHISRGPLWQRTEPDQLGMKFSPASLDFLIWLTATDATKNVAWKPRKPETMTLGDQFLLCLAVRALHETELVKPWFRQSLFLQHGLIGLMYADQFAKANQVPKPDFTPWISGVGAAILETLQNELAIAWLKMEYQKEQIKEAQEMLRLGNAQQAVLQGMCDAAEQAGRQDLCRFLLVALQRLLKPHSTAQDWTRSLDLVRLRMADRARIHQAVLALLRQSQVLKQWHSRSLAVGYFDEDYAASQLWKSDWERYAANESLRRAEDVINQLMP